MRQKLDYIQATDIAIQLMRNMQYDNGCINIDKPEIELPENHLNRITTACLKFFGDNPELIDDEVLEEIAYGEWTKNQLNFSHLKGYKELEYSLEKFFKVM